MKSAPPEQVRAFFQQRQKVVLTFVGYYGSGYEHETTMLAEAKKVLIAHSSQGTIVNIGAMPDGIGQVYAIAKEMGFETTGIASTQAQASQAVVSPHVDTVFFIDDAVWGGFLPDTEVLSPTSQLVVECSDIIIAIGGNAVTRDEMISARRLGKTVKYIPADMNHSKELDRARNDGAPTPRDFRGAAYAVFGADDE